MPNTFELIGSTTVGSGGTASIDFTSIPSTYTDLCINYSARCTTDDNLLIKLNGSSSNFSYKQLFGSGSAASAGNGSIGRIGGATGVAGIGSANPVFASGLIYIANYAGSTHKSLNGDWAQEANATLAYISFNSVLWANTAAITSISLVSENSYNFVQYTTAYLYGVKNA